MFAAGEPVGRGVGRDARGRPAPGNPDAVAHEERAVATGDVVQVELGRRCRVEHLVDAPGDRVHVRQRGETERVATRSWVRPPLSWVWRTAANPAAASMLTISSGDGR